MACVETVCPSPGLAWAIASQSSRSQPSGPDHSARNTDGSRPDRADSRSWLSTTDWSSPALLKAQICAFGLARVVLDSAPHAAQSRCSRNSSRLRWSTDRPRPADRVAAVIRYRAPELSSSICSPLAYRTVSISAARSGTDRAVSTDACQASRAMSRLCAAPRTSRAIPMYSFQSDTALSTWVLPFWRATRTRITRNRNEPSGFSSKARLTSQSCHGSSGSPSTSRQNSAHSYPRVVFLVSRRAGGVNSRGSGRPSSAELGEPATTGPTSLTGSGSRPRGGAQLHQAGQQTRTEVSQLFRVGVDRRRVPLREGRRRRVLRTQIQLSDRVLHLRQQQVVSVAEGCHTAYRTRPSGIRTTTTRGTRPVAGREKG